MSAASLGSEFENNTMERLLSQPLSRKQLWHEKMGVLFICIEAAVFAYIAGFFLLENKISISLKDFFFRARVIGPVYLCLNYYLPIQFAFLSSVCAGTLMALYLKKTHTAFWASITATALILVIWQFLLSICLSILGIKSLLYGEKAQEYGNAIQLGLPLFLWCIVSYFLARRKFMRMEV
jgi:ABC-type transport system involved in multi-copper enzyme maturation permease subunit